MWACVMNVCRLSLYRMLFSRQDTTCTDCVELHSKCVFGASEFLHVNCSCSFSQRLKYNFWVQELWKTILDSYALWWDSYETIIDRFIGVRHIYLAAIVRRRSRHGRYIMTSVTTVWRNALLHAFPYNYGSVGSRNVCDQFVAAQERRSLALVHTELI